jgi:hypothetical protein
MRNAAGTSHATPGDAVCRIQNQDVAGERGSPLKYPSTPQLSSGDLSASVTSRTGFLSNKAPRPPPRNSSSVPLHSVRGLGLQPALASCSSQYA